ncbi:MAG: transposase domain-containing protein [Myxococcales bacterium]|nr:transposase domain-containing protein [Myxococcales bacterium]
MALLWQRSHAHAAAALFSLVASCRLHDLDPQLYLEEVLRLLPTWPKDRYLELAPKNWGHPRAPRPGRALGAPSATSPSRRRSPSSRRDRGDDLRSAFVISSPRAPPLAVLPCPVGRAPPTPRAPCAPVTVVRAVDRLQRPGLRPEGLPARAAHPRRGEAGPAAHGDPRVEPTGEPGLRRRREAGHASLARGDRTLGQRPRRARRHVVGGGEEPVPRPDFGAGPHDDRHLRGDRFVAVPRGRRVRPQRVRGQEREERSRGLLLDGTVHQARRPHARHDVS